MRATARHCLTSRPRSRPSSSSGTAARWRRAFRRSPLPPDRPPLRARPLDDRSGDISRKETGAEVDVGAPIAEDEEEPEPERLLPDGVDVVAEPRERYT